MRVVLVQPRGRKLASGGKDVHSLACVLPPLGIASIAGVLRNEGHEVFVVDAALKWHLPNDVVAERIAALRPDIVGFTATTSGFNDACDLCSRVRTRARDARTVFGGVHASWGKDRILRAVPEIDYVVAGEGEPAMKALAGGEDPAGIKGLWYRDGTNILSGPEQSAGIPPDDLPFPAYDLLPSFPGGYNLPIFGYPRRPGATVVSSRGCVYRCSFCDRSVFGKGFRYNSPEYTFELLRWLQRDFNVRHVYFYDDLFTLSRRRVARLCELVRRSSLRMTFNCIVRGGHIDRDLTRELKSAGCWMVNVGIESGDQRMLDRHKSGITVETITRDVELLHREGLWVKGLFMMGFPGETPESIEASRKLALGLPLKDINVTAFTPFPGAPITSRIDELGIMDNDWDKMDCEHFVFVPRGIDSAEWLARERVRFIRDFYRRRSMRGVYAAMLWQSPHSYWRLLKRAGTFVSYARDLSR